MSDAFPIVDEELARRPKALCFMAGMSVVTGEVRAAEGYLLELMAWCAFADREGQPPLIGGEP